MTKTFKVTGYAMFEVVTLVDADDYKEAERLAADRDISVCIHGSAHMGEIDTDEFVLVDGCAENQAEHLSAEEYNE